MATSPAPAPATRDTDYLDAFARSAATLFFLIYGSGFVILAAYESRYGVAQFGALRPRTGLVGFAFVALLVLPVAAHKYGFANYGALKKIRENTNPAVHHERSAVMGCGFVITSFWMATAFRLFLFAEETPPHPAHFWMREIVFFSAWILLYYIYDWISNHLEANPKTCVMAAAFASVTFLGVLYWVGPETLSTLTIWFWVAASTGYAVTASRDRIAYLLDFRTWIAIVLSVALYVQSVMGHMQQKFGGGAPVQAVMYLEKSLAFSNGATTANLWLLDETEQGYYVLLEPGDHKAFFVPRAQVTSIYFGSKTDLGGSH